MVPRFILTALVRAPHLLPQEGSCGTEMRPEGRLEARMVSGWDSETPPPPQPRRDPSDPDSGAVAKITEADVTHAPAPPAGAPL